MPTEARGAETTPSASSIVCSGASGWATTETGTGWAGFGAAVPDGGGGAGAPACCCWLPRGCWISSCTWRRTSAVCSSTPPPVVSARIRRIFWRRLYSYFGRSWARLVSWLTSSQAKPPTRASAIATTISTAGALGRRSRRSRVTIGERAKPSRIASASGMKTSRAK